MNNCTTMKKKSINTKQVNKLIETRINEGKPRNEILEELSETYFDKKTLATLIAMTPEIERKKKYKIYNDILLGLLILTIILKVLIGVLLLANVSIYAIPFAFLMPLLAVFFAIEVSRLKAYIYRVLGLMAIVSIGDSLGNLENFNFWFILDISIGVGITFLAFYLGNQMFPNYGFSGPKKDEKGNILLE